MTKQTALPSEVFPRRTTDVRISDVPRVPENAHMLAHTNSFTQEKAKGEVTGLSQHMTLVSYGAIQFFSAKCQI